MARFFCCCCCFVAGFLLFDAVCRVRGLCVWPGFVVAVAALLLVFFSLMQSVE